MSPAQARAEEEAAISDERNLARQKAALRALESLVTAHVYSCDHRQSFARTAHEICSQHHSKIAQEFLQQHETDLCRAKDDHSRALRVARHLDAQDDGGLVYRKKEVCIVICNHFGLAYSII